MKGFSIIEVIIALSILLMGITSVIKLQSTGATMTSVSSNITQAQNLAQQVLQQQLSRSPLTVITSLACLDTVTNAEITSPVVINNTSYTIDCIVLPNYVPLTGGKSHIIGRGNPDKFTSAASVSVTVTWDESGILGVASGTEIKIVSSVGIVTYQ